MTQSQAVTLTDFMAAKSTLRHSSRDAVFVLLAIVHAFLLVAFPSAALIALGVWWNSNTIAHNFLHKPFFRSRVCNAIFGLSLTVLLAIPQTLWRERHLAHHRDEPWHPSLRPWLLMEVSLVIGLWTFLLSRKPEFFFIAYVPGYVVGLLLCFLQGYYEHACGTTSHYGRLYNLAFFNDGYHVEHHADPGLHFTHLPERLISDARSSKWPAVLRWVDALSLEALERWVLRSTILQDFVLDRHRRALARLMPCLLEANRVAIVGGGLFPRTALILDELMPRARLTIIDANANNLEIARARLNGIAQYRHEFYRANAENEFDLVVIPLAFVGDREAIYDAPPAPAVLVHDWIWRRRGRSVVVSLALLKRINLVIR